MTNSNRDCLNVAKPHTIKKFELINAYVKEWAWKVLGFNGKAGYSQNQGIVYIDCMSNAGVYKDESGNLIEGTAIRVIKTLQEIMNNFPLKKALLFFNDYDPQKIQRLELEIEKIEHSNVEIVTSVLDRDDFLQHFALNKYKHYQKLLLYDPFHTDINWNSIMPFLNVWGEVIINHMLYDVTTGSSSVKAPSKIKRYIDSYQMPIEEIVRIHTDRDELNNRIIELIRKNNYQNKKIFISYASFFNRKRGEVYRLIHCTKSIEGAKLFKKNTWKVFDNKSSDRGTSHTIGQLSFVNTIADGAEELEIELQKSEENCFTITDIAIFIHDKYKKRKIVPLQEVYYLLDRHPVFPSDGFKDQIKRELKKQYGVKIKGTDLYFED